MGYGTLEGVAWLGVEEGGRDRERCWDVEAWGRVEGRGVCRLGRFG